MKVRVVGSICMTAATAAFVFVSFPSARAQSVRDGISDAARNCGIKNFGEVNPDYYRGAQPEGDDYQALARLGVKTVIDLEKSGDPREEGLVRAQGMSFFRLRMSDKETPSNEDVQQFLRLVNDPANQPVFVHCHGGKHRTGAMTAVYRMTHDGWTATQAFEEMKEYDFAHEFLHRPLKRFVFDYYSKLEEEKAAASAADNVSKPAVLRGK